jgi:hypothetical protein
MLIDFSYHLSKLEKKIGSPEKPLSDLGTSLYPSPHHPSDLTPLTPSPFLAQGC